VAASFGGDPFQAAVLEDHTGPAAAGGEGDLDVGALRVGERQP
jgi:hypothetical protein